MQCEYGLCLYNRDNACICRSIEINDLGICVTCMLVTFDSDFLEAEKVRQLAELEARWNTDAK